MDYTIGNNPSYIWRSIFWGSLLDRGSYWRTGKGNSINVYKNRWLPRPGLFKPYSPLTFPQSTTVSDLKLEGDKWNEEIIKNHFLKEDTEEILSIPLNKTHREDTLAWFYDVKGIYTVKSSYHVTMNTKVEDRGSSSIEDEKWWKHLWRLQIPSKVKIFLWRACTNYLPTAEGLLTRKIIGHNFCSRCDKEPELVTHALLTCQDAKKVWRITSTESKINKVPHF